MAPRYVVKHLARTPGIECPCGQAFRVITSEDNELASVHVVEIRRDSRPHYHKRQTEYYFVLEGHGTLEIDGDCVPLEYGTLVMIPPGCVHRAVGELKIVNIVIPPFSADDEYLADQ